MDLCGKDFPGRKDYEERLLGYQERAMRTLGFAIQPDGASVPRMSGIVGIADPIREGVKESVETCEKAGVRVIMVTGDVAATAREIGRQLGIYSDQDEGAIITGPEFAALSDEEASALLPRLRVLSRARPDDKARLVSLLQAQGKVVAVTGDGTNDALALKKAQVGLSMGDGTARAKEVSDITILDNSFTSINKAILWGRSLYLNIQRFIMFQMIINICACLVVLVGAVTGIDSPLNVTQMLWVNLIMDTFAALALASLPPNSILMRQKPRNPRASIITPRMKRYILAAGLLFAVLLLGMYYQFISQGGGGRVFAKGVNPNINPHEMGIFFSVFVFLQFWNMLNARSFATGKSAFNNIKHSTVFWGVAAMIFVGQIVLVQFFSPLFNTAPLDAKTWLMIILGTSPVFLLGLVVKSLKRMAGKQE
jgi:Ca2+-transporting ATPase